MKAGRSISSLAAELERQAASKKDYLADTRKLSFAVDQVYEDNATTQQGRDTIVLRGVNGPMELKPTAHGQIAANLQIPKPYYDRMLAEAPDLLASNVNTWLTKQPARRLVRTLDGQVRAFLSDSYRPLDNIELAEAVLPKLVDVGANIVSCEVTDSRLYIKAITPRIAGEVKKGDVIQAGLVVSNSEVGHGSLRVEALDFRLVCTNGMIREQAIRKAHLGRGARGLDAIEDAREYFRTETREADDRAFFLKVQDAVGAMFNEERFNKRLLQYSEAGSIKIEAAKVQDVVEVSGKRFGLNEGERKSILSHLIEGGDLSKWGLANAFTRAAQDLESYDRSTELETIGGQVIELPATEWRKLAV